MKLKYPFILASIICFFSMSVVSQTMAWNKSIALAALGENKILTLAVDSLNNSIYVGGYFSSDLSNYYPKDINGTSDFSILTGNNIACDAFIVKYDLLGKVQWAIKLGSEGFDFCNGISVDNYGNIYVSGNLDGSYCNFIGTNSTHSYLTFTNNIKKGFVASFNANGNFRWVNTFQSTGDIVCQGVCTNSNGIFISGQFENTMSITGYLPKPTALGGKDGFIGNMGFDGTVKWVKTISGANTDNIINLTTNQTDVFAIGNSNSSNLSISGHSLSLSNNNSNTDIILVSLKAIDGTYNWSNGFGSPSNNDEGRAISIDNSGIYCTGFVGNNPSFPNSKNPNKFFNGEGLFVSKFDFTGKTLWDVVEGSAPGDTCFGNTISIINNSVYIGGGFTGYFNFNNTNTITTSGSYDQLIAKYNANDGSFNQLITATGNGYDIIQQIASVGNSELIYGGEFQQTITHDLQSNSSPNPNINANWGAILLSSEKQPAWKWSRGIASGNNEYANATTVDIYGNVITVGTFTSDLSSIWSSTAIQGNTFANPNGLDGFVVKYDKNGNYLYGFSINGSGDQECLDVKTDYLGNIFVAGYFQNTTEFAGLSKNSGKYKASSYGGREGFIASYTSDGVFYNILRFWGDNEDQINAITVDSTNVYFIGNSNSSLLNIDPLNITINSNKKVILGKLDRDALTPIWVKTAGGMYDDYGKGISIDSKNIYATGTFNSSFFNFNVGFGTPNTISNTQFAPAINFSTSDIWVSSINKSDGSINWIQDIGGIYDDHIKEITNDNTGVYIAGGISGDNVQAINFPTGKKLLKHSSGEDIFIASLNKNTGLSNWQFCMDNDQNNGSNTDSWGNSILADGNDNIYVSGRYAGTTAFDTNTYLTAFGLTDIFVAKLTNTGLLKWVQTAYSSDIDYSNDLAISPAQEIYSVGAYGQIGNFDKPVMKGDLLNIYIAKLGDPQSINISLNKISNDQKVCKNSVPSQLTGSIPTGGNGSYTYRWEKSKTGLNWMNAEGTNSQQNYFPIAIDTLTYYRRIVFSGDSNISNIIKIQTYPKSSAILSTLKTDLCTGDTINLSINFTGILPFSFNIKDNNSNTITYPNNSKSNINIKIPTTKAQLLIYNISNLTDSASCIGISNGTCNLQVKQMPKANAGISDSVCGLSSKLNADPSAYIGFWKAPLNSIVQSINKNETNVAVNNSGTYLFSWILTNDYCVDTSNITISFFEDPLKPNAGPNQYLYDVNETTLVGDSVLIGKANWSILTSNGNFDDPSNPKTKVRNLIIGNNELVLTVTNGNCPLKSDTVLIQITGLKIPSGFSPNADSKNDEFEITGLSDANLNKLLVYNRWGNLVYEKTNYANTWNGKDLNGLELPDDTYFYVFSITENRSLSGYVVIKR